MTGLCKVTACVLCEARSAVLCSTDMTVGLSSGSKITGRR